MRRNPEGGEPQRGDDQAPHHRPPRVRGVTVTVLYHEDFRLHDPYPYQHPENPGRLDAALEGLGKTRGALSFEEPCLGDPRLFASIHDEGYVKRILSAASEGEVVWLDPDTYVSPGTTRSLERLACASQIAAERALEGGRVLLLGRPPGHHAGVAGPAMGAPTLGFCIFNASALVARLAASKAKVAVLDFDAHHGNGTQEILWLDPIMHVDIHQDPATIYPGTGYPEQTGGGGAAKVNIILPPGSRDDIGLEALRVASSFLEEFDPDLLVVSAGFDGMEGDNLMVGLELGERFYYEAGRLASRSPAVAVVWEGGYGRGLRDGFYWFLAGLEGVGSPPEPNGRSTRRAWEWFRRGLGRLYEAHGRS